MFLLHNIWQNMHYTTDFEKAEPYSWCSLSFHILVLQVKMLQMYKGMVCNLFWKSGHIVLHLPCPALVPYLLNWKHTLEYNNQEKIKQVCKKRMTGKVYFCAPAATTAFLSGIYGICLHWYVAGRQNTSSSSDQTLPLNMPLQKGPDCSWWNSQTCKKKK